MAKEKLPIIIFIIGMLVQLSAGEIAVLAGQKATLPCMFEGIPSRVTWLKEDSPYWRVIAIYGGSTNPGTIDNGKYSVQKHFSSGKSSFSLSIAEVEIADAGQYSCAVTDNGKISSNLYHLTVLDALTTSVAMLNTSDHESATASVVVPALHGTSTTPASETASVVVPALHGTSTTPASETDRQNKTAIGDTGSEISPAAKFGIAFGVILGVVVVVALVIIAINRKRIREAI